MNIISQIFIVLMLFALSFGLMADVRGQVKLQMLIKLLKSAIFLICGFVTCSKIGPGSTWVEPLIVALIAGFIGDFALEKKSQIEKDPTPRKYPEANIKSANMFLKFGMGFFFIGHLFYIITLQVLFKLSIKVWIIALIVMLLSFFVLWFVETRLRFFKINFGNVGDFVYIYNIVLSVVVGLALGLVITMKAAPVALHLLGTVVLFYISDFILIFNYFSPAKDKKIAKPLGFVNHLTYYAAQLGFALLPLFFI